MTLMHHSNSFSVCVYPAYIPAILLIWSVIKSKILGIFGTKQIASKHRKVKRINGITTEILYYSFKNVAQCHKRSNKQTIKVVEVTTVSNSYL